LRRTAELLLELTHFLFFAPAAQIYPQNSDTLKGSKRSSEMEGQGGDPLGMLSRMGERVTLLYTEEDRQVMGK